MTRDIRDAWRQLRRRPILTLVAVLTLAIGTGANTAFFSLLNALLLRPLRVPAASQLVSVTESEPNGSQHGLTTRMVQALADRQSSLAAMCGYAGGGPVRITVESEEFSGGWEIAGRGFLETLGLRPKIGRFFEPADEGRLVVVITDRFWRRRLASDPAVLGRRISLEGTPVSIVGVAPESYEGLELENPADIVLLPSSYNMVAGTPSDPVLYSVLGRLRDDATIGAARANFSAIWPGVIAAAVPPDVSSSQRAAYLTRRLDVDSARNGFSFLRTRYAGSLTLLVGLTLWMLVIAGVNLAGTFLAGAAAREQEFRVRVALGASRGDLVRQSLAEAALLTLLGTLAGLPLVTAATPHMLTLFWPTDAPLPFSLAPDWRVLGLLVATLAAVSLIAGLAPAWLASRQGAAGTTANTRTVVRSTSRWERGLLVAEIALSLVLLAGAGLFIRTLVNLRQTPMGFDLRGVLVVSLSPRPGLPRDPNDRLHARELVESLTAVPGIAAAAFINHGLMMGVDNQDHERVAPTSVPASAGDPTAMVEMVSPGFFATMSIPFERGRDFTWDDAERTPRLAVVTATEASRLFPGEDAVGRHIRVGASADGQDVTIVGVVADSALEDLHVPHPATVFLSLGRRPGDLTGSFMQVRTSGDPDAVIAAIRARVASLGFQAVENIYREAVHVNIALTREWLAATLGALFAALAMALVAIGSYGLFSHWVTRRTRELGVRMALGASPKDLRGWIFRQSAGLTIAGILVGLPAAFVAARLINASLFGLSAHDPLVFVGATGLVVLAAVSAVAGPAARAFRLDPVTALRSE
ncbi:MAG: ADOP family duplicated permease [Vicinamibacterales bacterium]